MHLDLHGHIPPPTWQAMLFPQLFSWVKYLEAKAQKWGRGNGLPGLWSVCHKYEKSPQKLHYGIINWGMGVRNAKDLGMRELVSNQVSKSQGADLSPPHVCAMEFFAQDWPWGCSLLQMSKLFSAQQQRHLYQLLITISLACCWRRYPIYSVAKLPHVCLLSDD